MKIMDLLIDEINKDRPEDEKFTRLHSEPYRIVKTNDGLFHVNRPGKGLTPFGWDSMESAQRYIDAH